MGGKNLKNILDEGGYIDYRDLFRDIERNEPFESDEYEDYFDEFDQYEAVEDWDEEEDDEFISEKKKKKPGRKPKAKKTQE